MTNETSTRIPAETPPSQAGFDLRRPRSGRIAAGVAAGLGNRFAVNPWWFRIGFIVLAFVGGSGILLYLLGWLLIPEEGAADSILGSQFRRIDDPAKWLGAFLIGLAVVVLLASVGFFGDGVIAGVVLVAFGVLLYRGDLGAGGIERPAPVPSQMVEELPTPDTASPAELAPASPSPSSVGVPRSPSLLGRSTLAAVLIVVGGVALLDQAGAVSVRMSEYMAAAILVIGAGLLVGSWVGRARWLAIIGFVMLPLLFVTSFIRVPLDGTWGEVEYRPLSTADLDSSYTVSGGTMLVDLRMLEPGSVVDVATAIGIGEISIIVPADAGVSISGHVGLGVLDYPGSSDDASGVSVDEGVTLRGSGSITIDADVGIGRLYVTTAQR